MVEVASRTLDRSDLRKAWIMVDMWDVSVIPVVMEIECWRGSFRIGVRCYRIADMPAAAAVIGKAAGEVQLSRR